MLNMEWVTFGLKIKASAHTLARDSLEGDPRKWLPWSPLGKEMGDGRKGMEERFSFHQTLFFNLSNVVLCAFITQLKVSFKKQILKDSSFQTTWRMFTDITISPQGLF